MSHVMTPTDGLEIGDLVIFQEYFAREPKEHVCLVVKRSWWGVLRTVSLLKPDTTIHNTCVDLILVQRGPKTHGGPEEGTK